VTRAPGPRPWSIRLFAVGFLLAALGSLADHLARPLAALTAYSERFPGFEWTADWVIVASFTEFTIALIPIVWIHVFASEIARGFVVVLGLFKLLALMTDPGLILLSLQSRPLLLVPPVAILIALGLLFTPSASRWLRRPKEVAAETFA
jgi:hypothetical protein